MGPMCVRGGWLGGAHHKNQLNVLPFSVKTDIYLYLPICLNPRGGRQTGIQEYQVLRGLVETK